MTDAIAHADRLLFEAVFRTCDLEALADLLTEDFEFYHDKWGFTANSRQAFVESIRNLCERQKKGLDFRGRREIVQGSVAVYPIGEYGAIQTGVHRFYKVVEGQSDTPAEIAKFTHLWKKDGHRWRLARVFSYDHQPADAAPHPQADQGAAAARPEPAPATDSAAAAEAPPK